MLLVFALDGTVFAASFAEDIDAHIRALHSKRREDVLGDVRKAPDLTVAAHVAKVENTEVLKHIATNLLVVPRAHLRKGVRGLLVPFLAFLGEFIEEVAGGAEENCVKEGFHGGTVLL
jgi:hypothetical protein